MSHVLTCRMSYVGEDRTQGLALLLVRLVLGLLMLCYGLQQVFGLMGGQGFAASSSEFANSFVLAKMKIAMEGRHLWLRTIGSTLIGQGLDSAIFVAIAFAGVLPGDVLVATMVTQWLVKSGYEAAATPLTYLAVGFLKRKDGVDVYDRDTRFNPLLIAD